MKKVNRAAAREWQQETSMAAQLQKQFEDEKLHLWYAANKRKTGYPSAEVFENAGHNDVAALIRQAWRSLDEAYTLLEKSCQP